MNRLPLVTLVLVPLLLGACSKGRDTVEHASSTTASKEGEPALCDPAHPGSEGGSLDAGGTGQGEAARAGRFTLAKKGECRRVALALLAADGSAAPSGGHITGAFDRAHGIVRIPLPRGITEVSQADTAFADGYVSSAYIVHGLQDGFFLDVHLASPVLASAHAFDDPARLFVDLTPGGGAVPTAAPRARNVVVIEPRKGAASYPLVIRGYARTFEANVIARFAGSDSVRAQTTASDWSVTWGEFELTIANGPLGAIELFVGEDSAQDGTPIGVTIPLEMR
jgi:Immunoglobulin-like domain of bacterial spore germination